MHQNYDRILGSTIALKYCQRIGYYMWAACGLLAYYKILIVIECKIPDTGFKLWITWNLEITKEGFHKVVNHMQCSYCRVFGKNLIQGLIRVLSRD